MKAMPATGNSKPKAGYEASKLGQSRIDHNDVEVGFFALARIVSRNTGATEITTVCQ